MFTGGAEQALLFALFVQLHLFTVCVNTNLRVLLCCRRFSFQWKYAARVQGINNKELYLVIYFLLKEPVLNCGLIELCIDYSKIYEDYKCILCSQCLLSCC